MTIYAKAPDLDSFPEDVRTALLELDTEGNPWPIEPGRTYAVLEGDERHQWLREEGQPAFETCFSIRNAQGNVLFCRWEGCAYLIGKSWTRVEGNPDG